MLRRAAGLSLLLAFSGAVAGRSHGAEPGAEYVVRALDEGDILFPLRNLPVSTGTLFGAQTQFDPLEGFAISGVLGPVDINAGDEQVFAVHYLIQPDAPEGLRELNLRLAAATRNVRPGLGAFDSKVRFLVDRTPPGVVVKDVFGDAAPPAGAGYVLYTPLLVNVEDAVTRVTRLKATPLGAFPPGRGEYEFAIEAQTAERQIPPGPGLPDLPSGEWAVMAEDLAGNSSTVTIRSDVGDPVVTSASPPDGEVLPIGTTAGFLVTLRDDYSGFDYASTATFRVRLNGEDVPFIVSVPEEQTPQEEEHQLRAALSGPLAPLLVDDDQFVLEVEARDRAGRVILKRIEFQVVEDPDAPVVTIQEGVSGGRVNRPTPGPFSGPSGQIHWLSNGLIEAEGGLGGLRFDLSDALSGLHEMRLQRTVDPPLALEARYPTRTNHSLVNAAMLEDRPRYSLGEVGSAQPAYQLNVEDRQGNVTSVSFNVDSVPPRVVYQLPVSQAYIGSGQTTTGYIRVDVAGTATDDGSGVAVFGLDLSTQQFGAFRGPAQQNFAANVSDRQAPHPLSTQNEQTRNVVAVDGARLVSGFNPISLYRFRIEDRAVEPAAGWTTMTGTGDIANWIRQLRLLSGCVPNLESPGECQAERRAVVKARWSQSERADDARIDTGPGGVPPETEVTIATLVADDPLPPPPQPVDVMLGGNVQLRVEADPGFEAAAVGFTMDVVGGIARMDVPVIETGVGQNITLNLAGVSVRLRDVQAPGGRVALVDDFPVTPPPGYRTPPGMPANRGIDLILQASVNDGFDITMPYLQAVPSGLQGDLRVFHLLAGGNWEDVTVTNDPTGRTVTGRSLSASPFAVFIATGLVPADTAPPVTELKVSGQGRYEDEQGRLFAGPASDVRLESRDDDSGVLAVYYAVDPSSTLLAGGLSAATAASFTRYESGLTLAEGRRELAFGGRDRAGNFESLVSSTVYVDHTPPAVALLPGPAGSFTIEAQDPLVSGAASGVAELSYLVDAEPQSCDGVEEDPSAPAGTCANLGYAGAFTLAPGTHTVYFVAEDHVGNGTGILSSSVTVAAAPQFQLSRSSGPIGQPLVVTGAGFGAWSPPATALRFGTVAASVSIWNDAQVSAAVPGLAPGIYALSLQRAGGAGTLNLGAFTILTPFVASVTPSSGPIGTSFALEGTAFGPYGGANTRVLIGGATAPVSVWNDSRIVAAVPGTLGPGVHELQVERRTGDGGLSRSATAEFEVLAPAIASLAPSTGPIGVPFTLKGTGFGAYGGANTQVLFGGTTAAVSVWNDATIQGTVPALPVGDWPVVVRRVQGGGEAFSAPATFTVTALALEPPSPSSGPVGTLFTLTGTGFGPYGGANTRVLLGGATVPVSVWNDGSIRGTVIALPPGPQPLWIERRSGTGLQASNTVYIEVLAPGIASLNPSTGPAGVPFTLSGTGFGAYGGANTQVLFGSTAAAVSVWNDTTIQGVVPGLPEGGHDVVVRRVQGAGEERSAPVPFTLTALALAPPTPSSGPAGTSFTLAGQGFGPYAGANTRLLLGGTTVSVSVWNDTTITGAVPVLAEGAQPLWLERRSGARLQSSNTVYFEVLVPAIAGVSPEAGPIGVPFTLTGTGFGLYGGANTQVLFGTVPASVSLWSDASIKGTVPALAPGAYALSVRRAQGGAAVLSAPSTFTVLVPEPAGINPSSAPIGAPFTVTGSGFGPYGGANTRVSFGGVFAPVSVWNDTTITGTVPGALSTGPVSVRVERAVGTTVSASEPGEFLVLRPVVSTVTPSFGPAGTLVTLSGSGFGPYGGSATGLLVGGSTVSVSVWNDGMIRWTVPSTLPDGAHELLVVRQPAGGSVASEPVAFTKGTALGGLSLGAAPLAALPDMHFEGGMNLPADEGGRIETPAAAAVTVPPGALESDTVITVARDRESHRSERLAALAREKLGVAGEPIEFGPSGTRFATPVLIELPYDPASFSGAPPAALAVHYYDPAARTWTPLVTQVDAARRVLLARTDHFSLYQALAPGIGVAAVDDFSLRDHYAFPNPSRRGQAVTFRVQPGLADSLVLRVYDLAGRKVHESSRFNFTAAFDDGNGKGAQHTYDHVWDVGGVGSGVYRYVITARRTGRPDIRVSGKAGVIK
jgi:hypothetical protein